MLSVVRRAPVSRGQWQKTALRFKSSSTSHDEEDRMIGPYPHVKFEYYNHRPQDVKYDDQQGRRNLNEPLHYKFDHIDVWSPDHFDSRPNSTAARWNLYFIGAIAAFSGWCYYIWEEPEFERRQYPFDGLKKALGNDDEIKARSDKTY